MNKNSKPQPYKADSDKQPIGERHRVMPYDESPYRDQMDAVWHCIAEILNCDLSFVSSRGKKTELVRPRQMFYYFARKHTQASLREIGEYAGGRHWSTVIHGIKGIENEMIYRSFKEVIIKIDGHITGRVPAAEDPELRVKLFSPYLGFIAGG